jgi:hypothetical protein
MDKKTILELHKYILNNIIDFYEYYKDENINETNFSNWNVRDVIGHINSWIEFSADKLEAIKLKKSFEDVGHIGIEIFNERNYKKYKNESFENVVNEFKIILEKYKNILDLFNEDELLSNQFPTGFSFALWKYMAMDLGIHPLMHILYHYIKNKDYDKFIGEIENSEKYFMEYSENDIRVYNFNDFFEDKAEMIHRFNELSKINKNNKMIAEIIKQNIGA